MYALQPHKLHGRIGPASSFKAQVCFRPCSPLLHLVTAASDFTQCNRMLQRLLTVTHAKKAAKQNKKQKKKEPVNRRIVIGTYSQLLQAELQWATYLTVGMHDLLQIMILRITRTRPLADHLAHHRQ